MDVAISPGPMTAIPVVLQVTDLERSRQFYEQVLGLEAAGGAGPDRLALGPKPGGRIQRQLLLATAPTAQRSRGLWIELESTGELLDIFMIAKLAGYPAARLVVHDGTLSATLFDPDGHPVQLTASDVAAVDEPAHHPGDDARWSPHDHDHIRNPRPAGARPAIAGRTHSAASAPRSASAGRWVRAGEDDPSLHPFGQAPHDDDSAGSDQFDAPRHVGSSAWRAAPQLHGRTAHVRRRLPGPASRGGRSVDRDRRAEPTRALGAGRD